MKTATMNRAARSGVDEQTLKDATAEAEARLREYDAEIGRHEVERDAAEAEIAAIATTTGNPVGLWQAEEKQQAAEAEIARLVAERRPWADRYRRLASVSEPLVAREREIAELRHAIDGMTELRKVFPLMDEICALVEQAKRHLSQAGGRGSVPPSLTRFAATWGSGGWTRHKVETSTGVAGLDAMKDRLDRLENGVFP